MASGRFVAGFLHFQWEPRREPAANSQHENILLQEGLKVSPAGSCRLQDAGYRLQATGCRLQAAGYRTSYRPQATGYKNSLLLVFGSCLCERIPSFLRKKSWAFPSARQPTMTYGGQWHSCAYPCPPSPRRVAMGAGRVETDCSRSTHGNFHEFLVVLLVLVVLDGFGILANSG